MTALDTASCATVVTANAGCGKTYTLTNVMIGWMVDHLRKHRDPGVTGILASTFTRKAAGEILERLLRHLAKGMRVSDRLKEYGPSFGLEKLPTVDELATVLEAVVAEMARMQIGTIDGLFHRLAKAFPGEAGLPEGWTIGSAPALTRLREHAIEDLLGVLDASAIEQLAIAAETEVLRGGGQRRILDAAWGQFDDGLLSLWRDCLVTSPPDGTADAAWRWMDDVDIDDISPTARLLSSTDRDAAVAQLKKAALPQTAKGADHSGWVKARDKIIRLIADESWKEVLMETLVQALVKGREFHRKHPTDEVVDALDPLIGHGRALLVQMLRTRLTVWRGILHGLDEAHRRVQRESGRYAFGDITDALARTRLLSAVDSDAIAFRLDNALRDIALDEFQDTSRAQFEILRPVLDELTSGAGAHESDRHLLVVADPKQSIYSWRGGTPALIEHIKRTGATSFPLAKSYRSSGVIMDFVNTLFGNLAGHPALNAEAGRLGAVSPTVVSRCGLGAPEDPIDAVAMFRRAWPFEHHETALKLPGEVRALAATDATDEAVIEQVVDTVRTRGSGSMGILCPRNTQIDAVVEALRAQGLPASHEGRGGVMRFAAVGVLFDVLRLAEHPAHTSAAFNVSHSPFGPLLGLAPIERVQSDRKDLRSAVSSGIRRRIQDEGFDQFVTSLVEEVVPDCGGAEADALRHVARCAARWSPDIGVPLTAFIEFVEAERMGTPSESAVRVMTMHGCKGLEFDEVVLPWLDDPLVSKRFSGFLPWSAGPLSPIEAVVPVVREELRTHVPLLEAVHQQAIAANLADRISLLYVAVTRPKQRLHLVFQPTGKEIDESLTAATLLRGSFDELEREWQARPEGAGGRFWFEGGGVPEEAVPVPEPPSIARVRIAAPRVPASDVTPSQVDLAPSCRLVSGKSRRDGVILHELFARVRWLDDGPPSQDEIDEAFDAAAVQLGQPVERELRDGLLQRFYAALESDVGDALKRSAHQHWDVDAIDALPEEPLLAPLEDGLLRGRIDRLVLGFHDGKVVRASVLDFKTGSAATPEARDRAKSHYAAQLERYAQGVAGAWDLPPDAEIETALLFIE